MWLKFIEDKDIQRCTSRARVQIILMFFELVFFTINNGKRTEWSLIWSVIIRKINTQESHLFNQQYDWSRKRKTQISSVNNNMINIDMINYLSYLQQS